MGGHYIGKFLIKVTLTNGREGYAMMIDDGTLMITDSIESAARFLTVTGAKNFFQKIKDLPNYLDQDAYICDACIMKASNF